MDSVIYGIGIGPGDPGLITVKGAEIIGRLNTIFIPETGDSDSRANEIIKDYIGVGAEVIRLNFSMSKDIAERSRSRMENVERVIKKYGSGGVCGIVTLGDPMTYSTFIYLYEELKNRCPVKIIPGITSYNALAAMSGLPLVAGNERFCVITDIDEFDYIYGRFDTVVMMKVSSYHKELYKKLSVLNGDFRFFIASNAGMESYSTGDDISILNTERLPYLTTVILKRGR